MGPFRIALIRKLSVTSKQKGVPVVRIDGWLQLTAISIKDKKVVLEWTAPYAEKEDFGNDEAPDNVRHEDFDVNLSFQS